MDIVNSNVFEMVVNSEEHIEMIDGIVVVENKTTTEHNATVNEIADALKHYIKSNNGKCRVFTENVGLYVNEILGDNKDFFLPDVMVVCNPEGVQSNGVHTTPRFVAEVTSESTKKCDYNEKLDVYKKIGVEEYWIVDIQRKVIYKYLKEEDYIPQTFMYASKMEVSIYNGLQIELSYI